MAASTMRKLLGLNITYFSTPTLWCCSIVGVLVVHMKGSYDSRKVCSTSTQGCSPATDNSTKGAIYYHSIHSVVNLQDTNLIGLQLPKYVRTLCETPLHQCR